MAQPERITPPLDVSTFWIRYRDPRSGDMLGTAFNSQGFHEVYGEPATRAVESIWRYAGTPPTTPDEEAQLLQARKVLRGAIGMTSDQLLSAIDQTELQDVNERPKFEIE